MAATTKGRPIPAGHVRVRPAAGELVSFGGCSWDAESPFVAPVEAVRFAVGVGKLEVVGRPEAG